MGARRSRASVRLPWSLSDGRSADHNRYPHSAWIAFIGTHGIIFHQAGKFFRMIATIDKIALAIVAQHGAMHLSSRRNALDLYLQYSNLTQPCQTLAMRNRTFPACLRTGSGCA